MEMREEDQGHFYNLRQRAEDVLKGKKVEVDGLTTEDIQFLLHELQVHQAELVLQNEELRQTQEELETSRDRYADLYSFAPAGYCTINKRDQIQEANHSFAALLGYEIKQIIQQRFSHFVARVDQDKYYLYRRQAYENHQHQSTEIRLSKQSGGLVYVRLESMVAEGDDQLMMMVIDITEQRDLQHRIIEQREKERQKIARDLHDGPVQVLSAMNFTLRGILLDHPDKELAQTIEEMQSSLREQIQILRNYSVELRSPLLAHIGLETAIRSYLEHFGEKNPDILIRILLNPIGEQLSDDACLALYRICQEAVQNFSKHAQSTATTLTVRTDRIENQAMMEIQDNGSGFHLPDDWFHLVKEGHLGLVGMRERAEAVGGQLEVQTSLEEGTRIKVLVPLDDSTSK